VPQESTPRHRIAAASARLGEQELVRRCADLLTTALDEALDAYDAPADVGDAAVAAEGSPGTGGDATSADGDAASSTDDTAPDVDMELVEILGGSGATNVLAGQWDGPLGYWVRTWSLRAFLYAWDPDAVPVVIRALGDEHWRVREMACKVLAKRKVSDPDAERSLTARLDDGTPRVRAAARRALRRKSPDPR
jgi:HEAT repeat protein